MGNIRKIKKKMGICMAKTGITFEGCEVVLALVNPSDAEEATRRFRVLMNRVYSRAGLVNIHDIIGASLSMRKRIVSGEPIWN